MEIIERAHCARGVDQRNDHKWLAHSTEVFGQALDKAISHGSNGRLSFDMELPCPAYTSYPTYNLETGLQKLAVSNMRQSSKTVRQARSTQTAVNATAMK